MKEKDAEAAADLYRQVLEIVPDWSPAWFGLGKALTLAGDTGAADAFRRCLALAPDDALGAGLQLARLEGTAQEMPEAYVAGLFDAYAQRFDAHLTGALAYCGPAVLMDALTSWSARSGKKFGFAQALDLGCGTGLMAEALKGFGGTVDGVDLSPKMLAVAAQRGLYRALAESEIVAYLDRLDPHQRYDLILAADVLVYIGDLSPLLHRVKRRLTDSGLFAFTVQEFDAEGYRLGNDLRFAHSARYIMTVAAETGLRVLSLAQASTRRDEGRAVPGLVVLLSG